MVNIPAFCDTCGAAFPSGFVFDSCRNIHLHGNKSGPCPRCGGMGSVIDGVFSIAGDVIEILAAPQRTIESLEKLSELLKEAAAKKESGEELSRKIEKEVPEYSSIAKFVPKDATDLVAWLTLILIAIQTINGLDKDETPDVNVILNYSVEQSIENNNFYPFAIPEKPPSRNSPCPCGSGTRYKHCCGKTI